MKPHLIWFALVIFFIAVLAIVGIGYPSAFKNSVHTYLPNQREVQTQPEKIHSITTILPTLSLTPSPLATPSSAVTLPDLTPGEQGIKVPILLYHYISVNLNTNDKTRNGLSTPPGIFEQQVQLLATNGFTTITLDELAAAFDKKYSLPAKPVILTFDDGYVDFYFNAFPLLRKYNMKAVVFIPTGLIGGGHYMTWPQIDEISRSPNIEVEAHSVHHYALAKVSDTILKEEVVQSKAILEQHVGHAINWMAYPYGSFDTRVVGAVKKAGYIGAITTLPGMWQYKSRFYYIPRYRAGTRLGKDFLKLLL